MLGMSFKELEKDPDQRRLMSIAFTLEYGTNAGEKLLRKNPEFNQMVKQLS